MTDYVLHLGNKATSSWSLRGWLACKLAGIAFREVMHNLDDGKAGIRQSSPSGKVPCLVIDGQPVWESLAIAETMAEVKPGLWPADAKARAHARAISAEMHAGFVELRRAMWMNVRRQFPGKGRTPAALADIERIVAIWRETRARHGNGGPFLFGAAFNLADAMYAPVVARFWTWAPDLPVDAKAYVAAVWAHPLMVEWVKGAHAESWVMARYETAVD